MFVLIYSRDGKEQRHTLAVGDTIVGRAPVCDLTIDDPSISRRHAHFKVYGDHCQLLDLGGRNGTFVNGVLVTEAEVRAGDTIVLGRFPLRVERAAERRIELSDQHSIIESPGTMYRPVQMGGATGVRSAVEPERLLALLTEISNRLVRWQALEEILEHVVSVVFETVPVERAFLLLVDPETGVVDTRVARKRDGERIEGTTLSRTVIRKALDERVAMLANDARLDPRLAAAESLYVGNVRSFICAPLWSQKSVIGALYVDNPHTAQLSAADLDVVQALSSYAAVAIEQSRLTVRVLQETSRRERLQRYHSTAVVDRILRDGGGADAPFVADEREVSVVFADIVGFTSRSERMAPAQIAAMLNRCFAVMCDAVFGQEGTLDKFIGDAILAVFGAPLDQPDHALRAVRAAAAMRRAVADLGMEPPLLLRIAINSGMATVGDIGSTRRREYTVLGDVVNTCSRLESTVCQPGQIVMSGATRAQLPGDMAVRSLGAVRVRGREAELEVLELVPGAI